MFYISTRNKECTVTSSQAIKQGLSADGGLFVPENIPQIDHIELSELCKSSYNKRAFTILKKFLTDFTDKEISNCVDAAYTREKFETSSIAPLYGIDEKTFFLELWHGPTCAFKDMALQILPHLLTTSLKKTNDQRNIVILVATSGDTGKAALEGFKDVEGTKIAVFYPNNGVSEIQRLQMVKQEGNNVFVSAVNGNFDDAQNGVKKIFTNSTYKQELEAKNYILSSANSINWGRLVPQIVYYFSAYCDLVKNNKIKLGEEINIAVPTGNFGNILAAYYSKLMGLPIKKLICASNSNNVLTDFINTGVYDKNREFKLTISPSMDILISSNLERLLFDLSGNDDLLMGNLMNDLSEHGKYELNDEMKNKVKEIFYGGCCSDTDTKKAIFDTFNEYHYLIDTHTAVAKKVYDDYAEKTKDETPTIIVSTASPFKFNVSVLSALEQKEVEGDEFELLQQLSKKTNSPIPKSLSELETKNKRFNGISNKDDMIMSVKLFLDL